MKYANIIHFMTHTPWAILPAKLTEITAFIESAAAGEKLTAEEITAQFGSAAQRQTDNRQGGAVAVLPVFGTISQRANMLSEYSGGTSVERLTEDFREALNDDAVSSIVLRVDSPGGSVYGVTELSDEIYQARGRGKRILAVVDPLMASAAYHIGSSADEIVVTPSGEAGSIGVLALHLDYSKFMEAKGVDPTYISAGKYKTEGNPYEPLTEEAKVAIQADVDDYYAMFVDTVARNRGTTAKAVREGYGEGRVLGAKKAVAEGLADRIDTFDSVIAGLLEPEKRGRARRRAAARLALQSV